MRFARTRAVAALLATALLGLAGCGGGGGPAAPAAPQALEKEAEGPLRRVTRQGALLGQEDAASGTYAWLGVPFAKAPVGELRWKPPAEPEPWSGIRHARSFGAPCAQGGRFFSPPPEGQPFGLAVRDNLGQPVGSEDCLTLNVWRPAGDASGLPVMVFIHGGSNISGYAADPIYHGAALAAKAHAVVVTVNYRLGLFGWFDLQHLKTGEPLDDSANFGTLDQVQALKYLQQNVEAFGGDPGNVTVIGESAGAVNVWALLVSPLTQGLFHKAVSLSGGIQTKSRAEGQAFARNLVHALLVAEGKAATAVGAELWLASRSAAQVAAWLRSVPADRVIEVALANPALGTGPAVFADGAVVPLDPTLAIATGNYRRVPMLAVNTREEGKLFGSLVGAYKPSDRDRFTIQYEFDPDGPITLSEADLIQPQYLPVEQPLTGWNTVAAAMTHAVFTEATLHSLGVLSLQQPRQVWYARFDWAQEPAPFDKVYGAAHAMDLPFWFGNFGRNIFSFAYGQANRPGREQLSDAMMRTLAAFAATGDPQHAGLGTAWPSWPAMLVLDASKTQAALSVAPSILTGAAP